MKGTLKQFEQHILSLDRITKKQETLFGAKIIRIADLKKQCNGEARVAEGFALSMEIYWDLLNSNDIRKKIKALIVDVDVADTQQLKKQAQKVRRLIRSAKWTVEQKEFITRQYVEYFGKKPSSFAIVRPSAVAQNLIQEEFPQLHETVFSVKNITELFQAIKDCYASLFYEKAIIYRHQKGLGHMHVAMSILIQKQYESVVSGRIYPADMSTGFQNVMTIEASYGTHEWMQNGKVQPDQFVLFKPAIAENKYAIISKKRGLKNWIKYIHKNGKILSKTTKKSQQEKFCLSEKQLFDLGAFQQKIQKKKNSLCVLDWIYANKGEVYITQVSPYSFVSQQKDYIEQFTLKKESTVLVSGSAIGKGIVVGKPVVVHNPQGKTNFQSGDVLVASNINSTFHALIKKASAIIVEQGTTSSYSAVMARELGIVCVYGVKNATDILSKRKQITIDASKETEEAQVFSGALPYEIKQITLPEFSNTKTQIFMQLSDPKHAFLLSKLPHDGIGILQSSYLFATTFGMHPEVFLSEAKVFNKEIQKEIQKKSIGYQSVKDYAVTAFAQSIAAVAAAAYPKPVQLKIGTDSLALKKLLCGSIFEPITSEQGKILRGAERILSDAYQKVLELEMASLQKVREQWGLTNVHIVLPECRSPQEGKMVLEALKKLGIERNKQGLQIHVCCDLPSNVVLVQDFVKQFDGLHISTNDLSIFSQVKNPQSSLSDKEKTILNTELKTIMKKVIRAARKKRKPVNVYGQSASDSELLRDFLIQQGVHSLSLNPDKLIESKRRVLTLEKTVGRYGKNRTHYSSLLALSIFAVFGSLLMTVGVGCTGPDAEVYDENTYVSPAALRLQAEKKQQERLEQQKKEQRSLLEIEDFSQFSVEYPSGWKVRYWNDGVTVQDPQTKEYMSIYKKLVNPYETGAEKTSIVVSGMPAQRIDIVNHPLPLTVVELQAPQYFSFEGGQLSEGRQTLLIEGNTEIINTFLSTFQFGTSSDAVLGRDLNQWDQKEGRFCAQVITYARKNEGEECTLFSSPCDVPKQWQVCEGEFE